MKQPKIKTSDQIVKNQHFTILELLDRLLDKGVMVKGEVLLSVADIDLIYLNLGLLLSSVKTVEKARRRGGNGEARLISWDSSIDSIDMFDKKTLDGEKAVKTRSARWPQDSPEVEESRFTQDGALSSGTGETVARTLPSVIDLGIEQVFEPKANIDPKNVEKGLAKLVLTLVDLIRKLMEKQAVRRMEGGFLTSGEIERMGTAFLLLDEKMEELKKTFALKDEDLNLDLGPLGELM